MIDKKNYNIMFAQEDDFKELSVKINKYFDKDQSYFRNLVPLLYKSGINTYDKHIVCKNEINEIVGVCAIYQKTIYLKENKQYKFIVIGTMSVDQEYRNLGIMSNIFKFIFDNFDDKVDFYCLSGSYERYKNFGFLPSFKTYKYLFNIKEHINYSFELLTENKISDYINFYNNQEEKVNRDNFYDCIRMWQYIPYGIKLNNNIIGYLVYDIKQNIVQEIFLNDNRLITDVMENFSCFNSKQCYLKIHKYNTYYNEYIDLYKEDHFERTLYKILNSEIKEIYIPRNDLI